MSDVKIILLCGGRLAIPSLKQLAFLKLLAVVVIPGHCREMIEEVDSILGKADVPVLEVSRDSYIKDIADAITEFGANTGLIITFSYILPASVYSLPANGFFNIHPGALPAYRGPDPIFYQIRNREKYAAATLHKVIEKSDAGPVVMEERVLIETSDTYGMLNFKLGNAAVRLVSVLIRLIYFDLDVPSKVQDERKANYYNRQGAAEVSIDWNTMDADAIIALVNACNPWNKGAVTRIGDKIIRFVQAEKFQEKLIQVSQPGSVAAMNANEIIVSTRGNEAVRINFIYTDEGFLKPAQLMKLEIQGNIFENMTRVSVNTE